jgi:hypothetical protein
MTDPPICYIELNAGLCNQLFMIATGYAHAKRNGYQLRLGSKSTYWTTILQRCEAWIGRPQLPCRVWREPRFSYVPIPPDARVLSGYFQSSKYFADVSGEIRALFASPTLTHVDIPTPDLYERGVVVHIRRGDYMKGANRAIHGILDERYYQRAMEAARAALGSNVPFLVFSDDLPWCRQQPWLTASTVHFVDEPDTCRSLQLMTQFQHFILSNSSFSWWAAWLSNKNGRVWVPNRWFGPMGPADWKDIYEPGWIKLPIT